MLIELGALNAVATELGRHAAEHILRRFCQIDKNAPYDDVVYSLGCSFPRAQTEVYPLPLLAKWRRAEKMTKDSALPFSVMHQQPSAPDDVPIRDPATGHVVRQCLLRHFAWNHGRH
ncbi:hypothetical protein PZN02_004975 [Sinorhizobium garamanticum]|uniref:Uncharacterized protein n=1 Tax=Sinorhizobium garamanticum TaxID=680247 RepID=A0ABY8DKC7_9HYPH|nr:hypothetical protein [Sinorhizobium garamanticum]WEX91368.1 hypothetical protein PZN02_004975 [Sinorhizobium garamanticum]